LAITGTKVCDKKYEVTIEKAIASARGRNSDPGIPCMENAGAKTARIQNRIIA